MPTAYGLDARTIERLVRMLRWFEGLPAGQEAPGPAEAPNWQFVRCTGPEVGTGSSSSASAAPPSSSGGLRYFPGEVVLWNAPDESLIVRGECWLHEINNLGVEEGYAYDCRQSGDFEAVKDDRRPLFVAALRGGVPAVPAASSSSSGGSCHSGVSDHITYRSTRCDPGGRPCHTETTVQYGSPVAFTTCDDCPPPPTPPGGFPTGGGPHGEPLGSVGDQDPGG